MRPLRTKSKPDRLLDTVGDSVAALGGGVSRSKLLKATLVAGGVAADACGAMGEEQKAPVAAGLGEVEQAVGSRPRTAQIGGIEMEQA